jgi:RNA polymerase sigma factor for flagellar operon FliA
MNNKELWILYKKDNSPLVKKQLIMTYVNLVHYVMHQTKFGGKKFIDERDFFEYGVQGLNEAIDRYDPDNYEQRFETFAIQRIRGAIIDGIRKYQEASQNSA